LPPQLVQLIQPRQPGDLEVIVSSPRALAGRACVADSVFFTLGESDWFDPDIIRILNQSALVLAPSRWAIDRFRADGLTAPLAHVPLGHDPLAFHPGGQRPDVCTFGIAAALTSEGRRRNVESAIRLFQEAFEDEPDVRLRVKVTPRCELREPGDPRIEVLRCFLTRDGLAEWYRSLTAYVHVPGTDGPALHPIEALACGVPLLCTCSGGAAEWFDEAVGFVVDTCPGPGGGAPGSGSLEINEASVFAAMRSVYRNPAEAGRRGDRAAARASRLTWKETGRGLTAVLEGVSPGGAAVHSQGASAPVAAVRNG
jgi:glycosyltransferase involved in cell wall biosynthesis